MFSLIVGTLTDDVRTNEPDRRSLGARPMTTRQRATAVRDAAPRVMKLVAAVALLLGAQALAQDVAGGADAASASADLYRVTGASAVIEDGAEVVRVDFRTRVLP